MSYIKKIKELYTESTTNLLNGGANRNREEATEELHLTQPAVSIQLKIFQEQY